MKKSLLLLFAFCFLLYASYLPGKVRITVYNDNTGLINETRKFTLKKGRGELRYEDVASTIDPTSVSFTAEGVSVVEQNYEYDLVSREKLYEKYIGRKIFFELEVDEKKRERKTATLLSARGGIILEMDNNIWIDPPGKIVLPELPEGLILKPTLVWLLDVKKGGKKKCEVSYLASGIGWHADYVGIVNEDDTKMEIEGWVTITNHTGTTYEDAKLKVVAGAVHRVEKKRPRYAKGIQMAAEAAPQRFEERGFFEYHLYDLKEPTTIRSNEEKQIRFINPTQTGTKKIYIYDGARYNKVQVKLEFKNSKENGLGIPLPQGKVRIYKRDKDGSLLFAGEDEIEHTPKDEIVRLYIGDAFDIVAERKVIGRKKIADRVREETYEISIRNHKDESVTVQVIEHLANYWEIIKTSHDYKKKDAHTVEFPIDVAKNGEVKLTYTVRYTW
jgi:hypothetical protein